MGSRSPSPGKAHLEARTPLKIALVVCKWHLQEGQQPCAGNLSCRSKRYELKLLPPVLRVDLCFDWSSCWSRLSAYEQSQHNRAVLKSCTHRSEGTFRSLLEVCPLDMSESSL